MFLLLWYLLHLPAFVLCNMITFLLGYPVFWGASVSVAVCHVGWFLPVLPGVFFSLSRKFLAHESHTIYRMGFHICQGCHSYLATGFHTLSQSGILPDLRVHYFLAFSCHDFYLSVTISDSTFYCSYLVLQTGVGHASFFRLPTFVFVSPLFLIFYAILQLPFYFLRPSVVPVVRVCLSIYLLSLVVCLISISVNSFVFLGPLFGLLLVLFEPISLFLVSWMWTFLLCISLVGFYQGHAWNNI